MRSTLDALDLGEISLQTAGADNEVMSAPRRRRRRNGPAGSGGAIKGALDASGRRRPELPARRIRGAAGQPELLVNSIWAVLISMLGVLLYLWFRFEWQYGVGAIASLVHDVSATIGSMPSAGSSST